jgi:hypothetical protein
MTINTETEKSPAERFAEDCGLTYVATFVPQSASRNSGEPRPSLNWRIHLSKGTHSLQFGYTQGIGHLPKPPGSGSQVDRFERKRRERESAQSGLYCLKWHSAYHQRKIPAPSLTDILACLTLDSSVLDAGCFEDWAEEYGYNPDSRSAEATYRECLAQAREFRKLVDLAAAREAFQDY